jgi:hypothetical protein
MSQHAEDNARAHLVFIAAGLKLLDEWPHDDYDEREIELPGEIPETMTRDDLQERLQEMALEVLVRADWHVPGEDSGKASDYQILLSTGGPACRILGTLGRYSEPDSATLQWQDWGEPWTDLSGLSSADDEILLQYASLFSFEEG